jgi:hypothetical protein
VTVLAPVGGAAALRLPGRGGLLFCLRRGYFGLRDRADAAKSVYLVCLPLLPSHMSFKVRFTGAKSGIIPENAPVKPGM